MSHSARRRGGSTRLRSGVASQGDEAGEACCTDSCGGAGSRCPQSRIAGVVVHSLLRGRVGCCPLLRKMRGWQSIYQGVNCHEDRRTGVREPMQSGLVNVAYNLTKGLPGLLAGYPGIACTMLLLWLVTRRMLARDCERDPEPHLLLGVYSRLHVEMRSR